MEKRETSTFYEDEEDESVLFGDFGLGEQAAELGGQTPQPKERGMLTARERAILVFEKHKDFAALALIGAGITIGAAATRHSHRTLPHAV